MIMNKTYIIAFTLLFISCISNGKYKSDAQKAIIKEKSKEHTKQTRGDTIKIDLIKSTIHWKGTKMRWTGKHEGEIQLKKGYFIVQDQQLINGNFVIDMSTIEVTDIPKHEPALRKKLNDHLKNSDFFDVEKFPIAEFQMTNVQQITSDNLTVSGNLTLKGVTKNIEFGASHKEKSFLTKFTLDRFQWNIAYETLVDKDIELTIKLEME